MAATKSKRIFHTFALLAVCFVSSGYIVSTAVNELMTAHEHNRPIPNLSKHSSVDLASAYQIQNAYVRKRLEQDRIAGFKAGLTSSDAQTLFGISRPVFGVLFKSGDYTHKKEIKLSTCHYPMIETEIGFITHKAIKQTVQSIDELKTYIGQVVPVIELPDVGFHNKNFNAIDLVAGNTGSHGFIVHTGVNWYGVDVNNIAVSLLHNNQIVNQGQGDDAFGDQWEALRWLVNQVIAHGWEIDAGHVLITGALGEMVVAKPGVYRAQFNDEAEIKFTVS